MRYRRPRLGDMGSNGAAQGECISGSSAGDTNTCTVGPSPSQIGCSVGPTAMDNCSNGTSAYHNCVDGSTTGVSCSVGTTPSQGYCQTGNSP